MITPPPVPTQSQMLNQGLVTRPWLSWFTTLAQLLVNVFFQTVQSNGTALPQEQALNFTGALTATDNPANNSVDISVTLPQYSVQFGQVIVPASGGDYAYANVVFPIAFATTPQVFLSPTAYPRTNNTPVSCFPTQITVDGFAVNFSCAVPTGGGGATVDNQIPVGWIAIA